LQQKKHTFKDRLEKIPEVEGAAYSFTYAENGNWISEIDFTGNDNPTKINMLSVDPDYLEVLGLELISGRSFSEEMKTDKKRTIILNEAAVKEIGYSPNEAVGKTFNQKPNSNKLLPASQCEIIGVIKNFHFHSLHEKIGPLGLVWNDAFNNVVNVRLAENNTKEGLHKIQHLWKEYNEGATLNYTFLSEAYNKLYKSEERLNRIFNYFAIIAIIIAIMGLYGLSTFIAENKTKEIGIRKALGSSSIQIIILLGRTFLKWVGIAVVIAIPIAYYALNQWLANYPYATRLSWDIFLMAAIISFVIAGITISFKTYLAANNNPADSLRYE
jgi:putative ABC transport system permease protein